MRLLCLLGIDHPPARQARRLTFRIRSKPGGGGESAFRQICLSTNTSGEVPARRAAEASAPCYRVGVEPCQVMEYAVYPRPEALEILRLCREGGREVCLFTHSSFGFAVEVWKSLGLGIDEQSVFSFAMILNCRRALCPDCALIENIPESRPDTQITNKGIGIGPERTWAVPSFETPHFARVRLFVLGLPNELARLDAGNAAD